MMQDVVTKPTICFREGIGPRFKKLLDCATDTAVAAWLDVDPGQYSRVLNGRSSPGPQFQARVLLRAKSIGLGFYDIFEIANEPEGADE